MIISFAFVDFYSEKETQQSERASQQTDEIDFKNRIDNESIE